MTRFLQGFILFLVVLWGMSLHVSAMSLDDGQLVDIDEGEVYEMESFEGSGELRELSSDEIIHFDTVDSSSSPRSDDRLLESSELDLISSLSSSSSSSSASSGEEDFSPMVYEGSSRHNPRSRNRYLLASDAFVSSTFLAGLLTFLFRFHAICRHENREECEEEFGPWLKALMLGVGPVNMFLDAQLLFHVIVTPYMRWRAVGISWKDWLICGAIIGALMGKVLATSSILMPLPFEMRQMEWGVVESKIISGGTAFVVLQLLYFCLLAIFI